MRIIISLTDSEMDYISKELHGIGGFQSLIRRIQTRLRGNELELNLEDIEKIVRYVKRYGTGGFQGRLEKVLNEIESLARVLRDFVLE